MLWMGALGALKAAVAAVRTHPGVETLTAPAVLITAFLAHEAPIVVPVGSLTSEVTGP